jgi:hypothetical protein
VKKSLQYLKEKSYSYNDNQSIKIVQYNAVHSSQIAVDPRINKLKLLQHSNYNESVDLRVANINDFPFFQSLHLSIFPSIFIGSKNVLISIHYFLVSLFMIILIGL